MAPTEPQSSASALRELAGLLWVLVVGGCCLSAGIYAWDKYETGKKAEAARAAQVGKEAVERAEADRAERAEQLEQAKKSRLALVTGRYQVVNPTPQMARNIMLLDTWTGTTLINCVGTHGVSGWCEMPSWEGSSTIPK